MLAFHDNSIEIKPYYSFEFKSNSDKANFEKTFDNVVKDTLVADVPIGVFLSGYSRLKPCDCIHGKASG